MNILAVIPARGGSKGIPRKNVRIIGGNPLISYAIKNAQNCDKITHVIVSTDDEEISQIAENYGAEVVPREAHLADDKTTLDPVIYDAVLKTEKKHNVKFDIVITLQATSPLLTVETLNGAITDFISSEYDTYISATNKPHLAWSYNKEKGEYYPLYEKRLNRQLLPPYYLETGGFFITRREFVTENSRMGKNISVYEIPEDEAVDIDTTGDWVICDTMLSKKKVVFRADGFKERGMGHIFHCLSLAYQMIEHEILFVSLEKYTEGIEILKSRNMPYKTVKDDEEFYELLKNEHFDIVINDTLDTTADYIKKLKTLVDRVISIEDMGEGAKYTDATINALYETAGVQPNVYSGEKYVCLRDEFLTEKSKTSTGAIKNILVIFGGSDPCNLTGKLYEVASKLTKENSELSFTFITGPAYDCAANGIKKADRIEVLNNVTRISKYMREADLAFTSQGRTVFELASIGVPSVVLAQNEREQLHTFAQMKNGFLNLGLGKNISADTIETTIKWLSSAPQMCEEMQANMLKHNLKNGVLRIKNIILENN